ncbi:MAG: PAS domain S-box protein [Chloroflexi bacterium]|nr:PAS domain S-box protein [Chloroflexota bacterium]
METVTQGSTRRRYVVAILAAILVALGLYLSSLYSYVLFHTFAELFSIIVAFGIFMVTWNSRRFMNNSYLLLIGIAFVFIGSLDTFHTLAYKGMGVFSGYDANLPTQLWIGARYIHSLSLLAAPLVLGIRLNIRLVFLGYGIATSLLLLSIFYWNIFPVSLVEGIGLTTFKIVSEYVISGILVGAWLLLLRKRSEFDKQVLRLLAAAIVLTIAAELSFTLYIDPYGIYNLVGHYFKIGAYYLTYKAVIETGLARPYSLMFRDLKQSQEELRRSNAELEMEIAKRSEVEVELKASNESLQEEAQKLEEEVEERRAAEETLQQSEERFRSVAQTATDAIVACNRGNIILWNRGAENIFGYSSDEIIGKPITTLIPERLREAHLRAYSSAASRGELRLAGKTLEATGIRKDKSEFPIELSVATWQADGQVFFTAIIRDITERKRLQEQLLSYERLATLGKIAGTISHELRNPLAAIDTSVFYLQTKKLKEVDEKVLTHLNRIHASVLRSSAIIQALQDFTQLGTPHLADLDLRAVVTEALLNTKMPATVQLVRNFPGVEALVKADSEQLRKAFGNVITNAVQAMGDKGVLTITISLNRDRDQAEVSFTDTGSGIAPEHRNRLFEPLFSTKTWGIGFGLPVVKAIIDKHNGTIEVKSEAEKGATFIVRLPLSKKN